MRTTIDRAGRLVVPKALRDQVGLTTGEVEVEVDGAELRVRPARHATLDERDGRLYLPRTEGQTTVDDVRELRLADQR